MTKIRVGVMRALPVDGNPFAIRMLQRSDDVMDVDVPDDGSEFLARIWVMTDDGQELMSLPMTMFPITASFVGIDTEPEGCGERPYPAGSEGDEGTVCIRPAGHDGFHSDVPDDDEPDDDEPAAAEYRRCDMPSAHEDDAIFNHMCNIPDHHRMPRPDVDEGDDDEPSGPDITAIGLRMAGERFPNIRRAVEDDAADRAAAKQYERTGLLWPNGRIHGDTR